MCRRSSCETWHRGSGPARRRTRRAPGRRGRSPVLAGNGPPPASGCCSKSAASCCSSAAIWRVISAITDAERARRWRPSRRRSAARAAVAGPAALPGSRRPARSMRRVRPPRRRAAAIWVFDRRAPSRGSGASLQHLGGVAAGQVVERGQRGRVELPQHRPELVGLPAPVPDHRLMRPGQHLDRLGQVTVRGDGPVVVPVGADQVGQHLRIPRVGLRARG